MGGGPAAGATAGETHEASCVEGCKLALVAKYTKSISNFISLQVSLQNNTVTQVVVSSVKCIIFA